MIIFIKNKKMNPTFKITRTSRKVLSQMLDTHTLEQLNKIPDGYNNNIIWNIGHIVVVQQMLTYKLSGLPMMISDEMVEKYKKGTKPEGIAKQSEVDEIQSLLLETIDKTEADFDNNIFKNYQEFTTAVGFLVKSASDAMAFNYFHEGIHLGVIMSIRKFV